MQQNSSPSQKKILFVCLGNICRSPAAEGIAKKMVKDRNLSIFIDSAGISGYHQGDLPDSRMRSASKNRGYILDSRSRQLKEEDLEEFDHILVMDEKNYAAISRMKNFKENAFKVERMASFTKNAKIIPDPYFGGENGFETVLNLLEEGIGNFLNTLLVKDNNT